MLSAETATTDVLHDLVAIHNDRIEGYEKAIKELDPVDADLADLFSSMADESRTLKSQLQEHLNNLEGFVHEHDSTTMGGKLYRAWMDVKATFSTDNRKAALESCEYGEDKAQDAYQEALAEKELSPDIRNLLIGQQRTLMVSHNRIKALRNAEQQ